jgi:peptidoglycan/LPS O-acetylase OafA/YrhL
MRGGELFAQLLGVKAGDTVGTILDRNRGVGPSFDHLRLLLATLVLVGHAHWTSGASSLDSLISAEHSTLPSAAAGVAWPQFVGFVKAIDRALLPAFFALSGFLVLGSALRLRTTSTFLAHRVLRIFPALVVEVTLSAMILGPLLTTVPLREYFTDPQFARYFGNMFGWITFNLPGMFASNPVPSIVNMNLWTLPGEFDCYLITAALLLTRIIYDKRLFAVTFLIATVGLATAHFFWGISEGTPAVLPSHMLVYYFFAGALFFHFRHSVPANFAIFAVAAIVAYTGLLFKPLVYLAPVPLTYCTVFFGLVRLPPMKLLRSGDYSYGMYLYGFPIAQSYLYVFPGLRGQFVAVAVLAVSTSLLFAAFSWHFIERHALALKANLPPKWFPTGRAFAKPALPSSTLET